MRINAGGRKTAGGSCKDLPPRFRLKIKSYVRVGVGSREITVEFSRCGRVEETARSVGRALRSDGEQGGWRKRKSGRMNSAAT